MLGAPSSEPIRLGDSWLVPPASRSFDDPDEAAFVNARRTHHPRACFIERVDVPRPLDDYPFARTYIRASADDADAPGALVFEATARHAKASSSWNYAEIATNHMIPNNRPDELAHHLLAMA
jgi:hypothetical protein